MKDNELETLYLLGQSKGLKEAADRLMDAALDAYRNYNDEEARILRRHSNNLQGKSEEIKSKVTIQPTPDVSLSDTRNDTNIRENTDPCDQVRRINRT